MKISSKLNELKPIDLNCNVFDVYSYDGLSMQDLLCQFFTKINECIKLSNETIDLSTWLVNEGLKIEVVNKLMLWLEDGTLENLINVNLFNTLNTKIENILKTRRYSELGSLDKLKECLFEGFSVDLDEDIELDYTLEVKDAKLFSSNNSTITLGSNGGIILYNRSSLKDLKIFSKSNIVYEKSAITCKYYDNMFLNIEIDSVYIKLNRDAGSVGIRLHSDSIGFYGVRVSNFTIEKVEKAIEFKTTHESSWITGCSFNSGMIHDYSWGVYTNLVSEINSTVNCAGNHFTDIKTTPPSPKSRLKQTIYDLGANIYSNCWFFDLHIDKYRTPNVNTFGKTFGSINNYYIHETPVQTSAVLLGETNKYHRIGYFTKTSTTVYNIGENYLELKAYGVSGDIGSARITIDSRLTPTMEATTKTMAEMFDIYALECDDNRSIAIFLKFKKNPGSWMKLSFYERSFFTIEHQGCITFNESEVSAFPLIRGNVSHYNKNEVKDIIKINNQSLKRLNLENGWTGDFYYRENAVNQIYLSGILKSGNVDNGTVIGWLPEGFKPRFQGFLNCSLGSECMVGFIILSDGGIRLRKPLVNTLTTGATVVVEGTIHL